MWSIDTANRAPQLLADVSVSSPGYLWCCCSIEARYAPGSHPGCGRTDPCTHYVLFVCIGACDKVQPIH